MENFNEIMEGIRKAINDERQAQEHYRMLEEKTADEKVKAVFQQMRKDEEEHERILESRLEAFKKLYEG